MIEWRCLARTTQCLECFEIVEYATEAQVIGHASVHQVKVSILNRIVQLLQFAQAVQHASRRAWWLRRLAELAKPRGLLIAAGATVIVDGDRRQNHRHCR